MIDFKVGQDRARSSSNAGAKEKPAAQVWLNVGYLADKGTDAQRFVSLPMGIPLDTMDKLSTRSSNQEFSQFQSDRNDVLDQVLEFAKLLGPGEDYVFETDTGFAIQIRRVNAEQTMSPATTHRPKLFDFGGATQAAA